MASFYSFSPKSTTVTFAWPKELTGMERIALSAQGDLQRVLSAFFARPIDLALIYSHTFTKCADDTFDRLSLPNSTAVASASAASPIVQHRQVHLQCGGTVVCVATSMVKISSARCAHLFLEEKYGIGQLFRKLEATPSFELISVGIGGQGDAVSVAGGGPHLWRKYKLSVSEIECDILEVFPSREMFVRRELWLKDQARVPALPEMRRATSTAVLWSALLVVFIFGIYVFNPSACL
ncbi:hypothetical protein DFH06DRAFT_1423784 [Mycena polygramma]|nr:hypothetical protein DFH06DRAFT_1423784 [Mycena polygramma]